MNRGTSTESVKSRLSVRVSEWVGKFWLSRGTWVALEEVLSRKVVFFSNQKIPTTYCAERILIPSFSFPYFAEILFIKTIFHSRDYSDIKILDWVDLNRLSRFESTQSVFHRLSRLSSTQSRASIYSNLQPGVSSCQNNWPSFRRQSKSSFRRQSPFCKRCRSCTGPFS